MDKSLKKLMKDFEEAYMHLMDLNRQTHDHCTAVASLIKRLHNELLIMEEQEKSK